MRDLYPNSRSHSSHALAATFALILGASAFQLTSADSVATADDQEPAIVIRPANYDPADELAYTRQRGEPNPGNVVDGKVWNQPDEDSRAAVSGAAPAPADAAGAGAPVSAASGKPAMRMTYAEAYAQIPFSRSEYEANPGYRHDAAMELVFGTMRPTLTSRTTTPYFSRYPDMFRYRFPVYPYSAPLGNGSASTSVYWNVSLIAY